MQTSPFWSPLLKRQVNRDMLSFACCHLHQFKAQDSKFLFTSMFASVIAPKYFFLRCVVSQRKYQTHDMIIVESGSKIVVLDC